jgi:pyruvate dehydrogenase E1 component alpha subunit
MPRTVIHTGVTERLEILDKDGRIDPELDPGLPPERLLEFMGAMLRARLFDDKALKLQRQGRMGTWASLEGQEAAQIGVAMALTPDDWVIPSFREHGVLLTHGVPGADIYRYWRGDERASVPPEGLNVLPPSVPVGSQLLHGVGVGLALKLQGKRAAAVAFAGDGGTSQGDFHEALNFGGVFGTPTVFFIQNNHWAISLPFKKQTAAASIAQKAHAYGIPGVQVDGNDVLAVYTASGAALERARAGEGPTLIEAHTYRFGNHTTSDEATRYRSPEELAWWRERDPILRLRRHLEGRGLWDAAREEALVAELKTEIETMVEAAEAAPPAAPTEMVEWTYAELPWHLREQRTEIEEALR